MTARARRTTLRCLALTLSLTLSAVVAEFAFRHLATGGWERRQTAFAHPFLEAHPDTGFLYRPRPGAEHSMSVASPFGAPTTWTVRIDERGFRVPTGDARPVPDPDARTILFVGDSYTFANAAEEQDGFVRQLEARLRAAGRSVTALNAGCPGFNTEQELAYLADGFDSWNPDVVVLGYVVNDTDPPMFVPVPPAARYGGATSWLWEEAKPVLNHLGAITVAAAPLLTPARRLPSPDPNPRFGWRDPAGEASRSALARMATLCGERDVPFVVFVLPAFTQFLDDRYPYHRVHEHVVAWGEADGYRVVDLFDTVAGRDPLEISVLGDGHPNRGGHRLLAEGMLPHLPTP